MKDIIEFQDGLSHLLEIKVTQHLKDIGSLDSIWEG